MTLNPQQFRYPKTADDAESDEYTRNQFAGVHHLFGSGDADELFHGAPDAGTPWPSEPKRKGGRYDQGKVRAMLMQGDRVQIEEVDPRFLHATQPRVTRAGVQHYLGGQYERTGRTFADQGDPGNRFPVVYERDDGKNLLLSGHHRGVSALLRGEGLRARRVRGGFGA